MDAIPFKAVLRGSSLLCYKGLGVVPSKTVKFLFPESVKQENCIVTPMLSQAPVHSVHQYLCYYSTEQRHIYGREAFEGKVSPRIALGGGAVAEPDQRKPAREVAPGSHSPCKEKHHLTRPISSPSSSPTPEGSAGRTSWNSFRQGGGGGFGSTRLLCP